MAGKRIVCLAALLLGAALTAPSAALASDPGVTVIGETEQALATFKIAKCKKGKHYFHAEAFSTDGRYELDAFIRNFSGFHRYDVALGSTNPNLLFENKSPGTPIYSSQFEPSFPVPGFGLIKFSTNGKRVGIGFGPAMWSEDGSTAVVLAGALECRYPKKKH